LTSVIVELTTCDKALLVELVFAASPAYVATMLCVPAARLDVLHVAVLELELPLGSATAPHPVSVVPSAVKPTFPVGAFPVTVAVKVTLAPRADGFAELVNPVLLTVVTTCERLVLVEPLFDESPPYVATMP